MPHTLDRSDPLHDLFTEYRTMSDRHKAALDRYLDPDGDVEVEKDRAYSRRARTSALEARQFLEQAMSLLAERFMLPNGVKTTVLGANDANYTVTTGQLDDDAREAFLHGQCHAFARALSEETGWEMAVIVAEECLYDADMCSFSPVSGDVCGCRLRHVVAVRPDGAHVDITGAHVPGTLPAYEGWDAIAMTASAWYVITRSPLWRRPATEVARTFVAPLLATLDNREMAVGEAA